MNKSISDAEKLLNSDFFYKPHRSHIINLYHIKRFVGSGGRYIIMDDGKEVPLSRRKKEEFSEIIDKI